MKQLARTFLTVGIILIITSMTVAPEPMINCNIRFLPDELTGFIFTYAGNDVRLQVIPISEEFDEFNVYITSGEVCNRTLHEDISINIEDTIMYFTGLQNFDEIINLPGGNIYGILFLATSNETIYVDFTLSQVSPTFSVLLTGIVLFVVGTIGIIFPYLQQLERKTEKRRNETK
ncbi:MAG: hypothetical protein ACTSV2_04885 [Candidatus Thorarchaeota archaeon]